MLKTIQHTCLSGASDFATVMELGFVPNRITVRNRTTLAALEWTENTDDKSYFYGVSGSVSLKPTFLSANGITVIDGSDKTNYVSSSYGFLLPKITDLNDTADEVLDITAERDDL